MEHIEQMLTKLERSFGKPRQAVDLDALHRAYGKEKSVPKLVKLCAQTIFTAGMPCIKVGVYHSGWKGKGIANMEPPPHIPMYGSGDFRKTLFRVSFDGKEIAKVPFSTLAFAVAHELSHIVLYSVNHSLQEEEKAVDLTAMFFGFTEAYAEGKTYVSETLRVYKKRYHGALGSVLDVLGVNQIDTVLDEKKWSVGYLSNDEMHYACSWIMHRRL
jgi:hypothetical protein